jgi:hypothetical protein
MSFDPEGILKPGSANRNAGAIRNKLKSIRQSHRALFRQFTATTNMPRTSNNSPASTEAGPKQTLVSGGLMRASTEFAKASSSMADMARAAGLSEEAFHPFFTEFGPTDQGWALLSRLNPSIQEEVRQNIEFGCNKRSEEATRLKAVLNLLRGCTFDEIDPVVEGVTVSDYFRPGSVTARGRNFLLSLEEDERSRYARTLNLPANWASPAPQAPASLFIHIPGQERSSGGYVPSTRGDEVMGPPERLLPEALPSVTFPGSQRFGWAFDPGTPGEVMGPARPPQPAASDNVFDDLGSLNVNAQHGLGDFNLNAGHDYQDVTGPAMLPQPTASGSIYDALSPLNVAPGRTDLHDDAHYSGVGGAQEANTSYPGTSGSGAYSSAWIGAPAAQHEVHDLGNRRQWLAPWQPIRDASPDQSPRGPWLAAARIWGGDELPHPWEALHGPMAHGRPLAHASAIATRTRAHLAA